MKSFAVFFVAVALIAVTEARLIRYAKSAGAKSATENNLYNESGLKSALGDLSARKSSLEYTITNDSGDSCICIASPPVAPIEPVGSSGCVSDTREVDIDSASGRKYYGGYGAYGYYG